jgi:hypothetical protein
MKSEQEVKRMKEEQETSAEESQEKEKKKPEEKLPFCTTAPSAEHSRGPEEEEPCDDSRGGDYEK